MGTESQVTVDEARWTSGAGDDFVVVKARHLGRWVSTVVIGVLGFVVLRSVFSNPNFAWGVVAEYLTASTVLHGIAVTLGLTFVCMLIGIALGVVAAVMRLSANPVVRMAAFCYVTFFRGTPVLVQLLFWFNLAALYPDVTLGVPGLHLDANQFITPLAAAILGLGLNEGAYMSEIVRAGIVSVDRGQTEAAEALGITRTQTMRRVVLPQAMRVIIPPTANETIGMLKSTSLVSAIAVAELLYSVQVIYARTYETIPLLLVASIWYLVATSILSIGQYYLERRFSRGDQRDLPPTPFQQISRYFRTHDASALRRGLQ